MFVRILPTRGDEMTPENKRPLSSVSKPNTIRGAYTTIIKSVNIKTIRPKTPQKRPRTYSLLFKSASSPRVPSAKNTKIANENHVAKISAGIIRSTNPPIKIKIERIITQYSERIFPRARENSFDVLGDD